MWVKICGNTNLEDAALAAELGADAVGFVFAASRRQVTAAQVSAITMHLPDEVERVGVFDSHDAGEIAAVAQEAGLTAVQLHGGLDEKLLGQLRDRLAGRVRVIQTLHWEVGSPANTESAPDIQADRLAAQIECAAALGVDRFLIDSKVSSSSGGIGVAFDWAAASKVFASAPAEVQLIVAGGLTPENVALAIERLCPWGVDVSSGVEASPGRKDPAKLAQFIASARGAKTP
jgi:phosphoribosylanthranilate isomerase